MSTRYLFMQHIFCFFQAEDGIRDLVRSRGLGDVYKRQAMSAGLPNTFINDLALNQNESLLFAATEAGPYVLSLIHI